MEEKIVYFETAGRGNTPDVLRLVKERAQSRGISQIVLASTRGDTARTAVDAFDGSGLRPLQNLNVPLSLPRRGELRE